MHMRHSPDHNLSKEARNKILIKKVELGKQTVSRGGWGWGVNNMKLLVRSSLSSGF